MATEFNFQVRGVDAVKKEIAEIGINSRRAATVYAARETVNVMQMESHPAYTYHSRAKAYGMNGAGGDWSYKRNGQTFVMQPVAGFFSARQFHYVMARIANKSIEIPYTRTFGLLGGWQTEDSGLNIRVVNRMPNIEYVMGNTKQSRHEALIPWKKVKAAVKDNEARIAAAAQNGIADLILGRARL